MASKRGLDTLPSLVDAAAMDKVSDRFGRYSPQPSYSEIYSSMSPSAKLTTCCVLQHYKLAPGEVKVGTMTDVVVSRIATCEC